MSEINLYPGDGMGGEVKSGEGKWEEEFMESWLKLYRYHEVYPWVEGKDIAEQFYLQGRRDEQKVRQEGKMSKVKGAKWFIKMLNEVRDTPGFKDATIDILEGEIKTLLTSLKNKDEEIKKLKKDMKGMMKFVKRDITEIGWDSTS